jgi:hypothetical protein
LICNAPNKSLGRGEVAMKKSIKVSLIFVGGLLAGVLLTFVVWGQISYLQYRDYAMRAAREQVFIASELRAHRADELQNQAEANLPQIVLAIHSDKKLQKAAEAPLVMRSIRDFYELNEVPVPAEISGILNAVPRDH